MSLATLASPLSLLSMKAALCLLSRRRLDRRARQIYGRIQLGDQEIRGGANLWRHTLINPKTPHGSQHFEAPPCLVCWPDRIESTLCGPGISGPSNGGTQRTSSQCRRRCGQRRLQPWRGVRMLPVAAVPALAGGHGLNVQDVGTHWVRPSGVDFKHRRGFRTGSSART